MVLLASEFDLSRFLNAEGYGERDKKFRIADVTSEVLERNGKAEISWRFRSPIASKV